MLNEDRQVKLSQYSIPASQYSLKIKLHSFRNRIDTFGYNHIAGFQAAEDFSYIICRAAGFYKGFFCSPGLAVAVGNYEYEFMALSIFLYDVGRNNQGTFAGIIDD